MNNIDPLLKLMSRYNYSVWPNPNRSYCVGTCAGSFSEEFIKEVMELDCIIINFKRDDYISFYIINDVLNEIEI